MNYVMGQGEETGYGNKIMWTLRWFALADVPL